jgi:hypothetical protein
MLKRLTLFVIPPLVLLLGGLAIFSRFTTPAPLAAQAVDALYADPASAPTGPLNVLHFGHSLVGHDMPLMVMQLAQDGHSYNSQLGWGTFLKAHWDENDPRNGFAESNTHPQFRDGREALASGEYDAVVLTEAVEIRDAIKYMESPKMLHNLAGAARTHNPDVIIYFYETWHHLDDPEGWLERIDRDLALYWEDAILRPALNYDDDPKPIFMIPGGQVMARFARAVEARGGVGPILTRQDLFLDQIHFNDYGAYLMALTHYAVLYQTSPVGLSHALTKADGTPAADPGQEAAQLMQEIVWQVVTEYPKTGVRQD